MRFFKSPMGKFLLVAIALVIVGIIVMRQMEKKIYGGISKSDAIKEVAKKFALKRISVIKVSDANYLSNKENPDAVWGIFNWYDINSPSDISEDELKSILSDMNIDFEKNPKVLDIKEEVDSLAKLVDFYK
jgi:hypothetical protein